MPEHMSGCSGKISLPSGRSMDLQIHHHVRHTFRDIQVLPESLLRIAGMHENGIPAKICSEALCFSLLPPLGRTPDSQRASGRIFLFCIRPFLAGARSSWSCTAEKDGISSPNKKSGHIFPGKAGFVRTPAWCRGGWLPCRLLFSGAGEKTI